MMDVQSELLKVASRKDRPLQPITIVKQMETPDFASCSTSFSFQVGQAISLFESGQQQSCVLILDALGEQPDLSAEKLALLANAFVRCSFPTQALVAYQKAVDLEPDNAVFHVDLAKVQIELKEFSLAELSLRRAILLDSKSVEAIFHLGVMLQDQQRLKEAVALYLDALQHHPRVPEIWINLGTALIGEERFEESLEAFFQLLLIDPSHPDTAFFQGIALLNLGEFQQALDLFRLSLSTRGADPETISFIATCLWKLDRPDLACEECRVGMSMFPDNPELSLNVAQMYLVLGQVEMAQEIYRKLLCHYPGLLDVYPKWLFALSISGESELRRMRDMADTYWRLTSSTGEHQGASERTFHVTNSDLYSLPVDSGPIRVAFLSAEVGDHVVGYYLAALLANIDRRKVTVELILCKRWNDAQEVSLLDLADSFIDVHRLGMVEARREIRARKYDVILETSGFTASSGLGLLAERCAPLQCHYIGYHATTGLSTIDYFIGDAELLPDKFQEFYSERLWRLPTPWLSRCIPENLPEAGSTASGGQVIFGCFNQLAKISDLAMLYWSAALHAVPGSLLLIKDRYALIPSAQKRIIGFLEAQGIKPDRVRFAGKSVSWVDHMSHFNSIDIALDTTPWSGATTTIDTLSMGVPLVAIRGETTASRMSSSLVKSIGADDWIAGSPGEFASIASSLADKLGLVREHKPLLQQKVLSSSLFDAPSMARKIEEALVLMRESCS
jgi:protein O-GlcNAc transferase